MTSAALNRMQEARASLLQTQPFFGVLSLKLLLIEDSTVDTMSVNSKELRFNPTFVLSLPMAELKAVIAHECMHLAMGHHVRQGNRDHGQWNEACDIAINHRLVADGFKLPDGALFDESLKDEFAERVYDIRSKRSQSKQKQEQNQPQAGQGQGGKPDPQLSSGQPQGKPQAGNGQGAPKPCPTGTFEKAGPTDSAEEKESEATWKQNVAEAIRAASMAGSIGGDLEKELRKALTPRLEWSEILKRFCHDSIKTKQTWNKRNKRFSDIYMPGKVNDGMGEMVIFLDSSGSTWSMLEEFARVVNDVIEDVEPSSVTVIYCDTKVNHIDIFEYGDSVTFKARGGGGTKFAPAFVKVDELGLNPVCALYLTDLDAFDTYSEPSYPVLWVTKGARGKQGKFGETVSIDGR